MTTQFQSRELVRDELTTLFTNDGSWQTVFNYAPSVNAIKGLSPVLIIRGRGTSQAMAGLETNPVSYQFLLSSWVLHYSEDGNWTSANAEDKLDELDKTIRQVIRNNADGGTYANQYRFDEGFSQVVDLVFEGIPYMIESRIIYADLPRGAV